MKRSLIFWFWNNDPDPAEIRRQIHEFRRKGIEGFFVHPMPAEFRAKDFPGGMKGYLSDRYFEMFGVAADCARELDMEVWIYDEGGWPSGTVNGRLPHEHPELRLQSIQPTGEILPVPQRPDLLNRKVTELFLSMVHEEYRKRFAPYFGKTIPGVFTDEPYFGFFNPESCLPWSPVLEERFREIKRYDAKDAVMRIFGGNDPQARQDYCEVWNRLIAENFLIPIREWCHANNLLFTGHFNGDDCIYNMNTLLGSDLFSLHRHFDIPGCDVIWRQIHPLAPETDFPRIVSSAAQGKHTISESFGVYGADLSLAEMKQIAALQHAAGIELIAPMALHYSNRGGRQVTTESNLFGNDPRWIHYRCYSDFSRRMSKVFDRTTPVVKVHVPFPVTALRRGSDNLGGVFERGLALAARQITYDYVPDAPEPRGEITPDVRLETPCPALRTRHLKSPRGERRIFVNAGLETIRCRFAAPEGFSVWYDPATGKRTPARPCGGNLLTLELPFAGTTVLLTLPGKPWPPAAPAPTENPRIPLDFRPQRVLRAFCASEDGLAEIPPPDGIPRDFCGTLRYTAEIVLPEPKRVEVVLPDAKRAVAELGCGGRSFGLCAWGPYRWQFDLPAGKSTLTLDLTTTAAPAMYAEDHLAMLREKGFLNTYMERCLRFERLFPDENPPATAYLTYLNPSPA